MCCFSSKFGRMVLQIWKMATVWITSLAQSRSALQKVDMLTGVAAGVIPFEIEVVYFSPVCVCVCECVWPVPCCSIIITLIRCTNSNFERHLIATLMFGFIIKNDTGTSPSAGGEGLSVKLYSTLHTSHARKDYTTVSPPDLLLTNECK